MRKLFFAALLAAMSMLTMALTVAADSAPCCHS